MRERERRSRYHHCRYRMSIILLPLTSQAGYRHRCPPISKHTRGGVARLRLSSARGARRKASIPCFSNHLYSFVVAAMFTRTTTRPRQGQTGSTLEQDRANPKSCYVYQIHVDGVLRYIGKGTDDRMYAHMKEVRQRLTRKFKLRNVYPIFQRKLTEAVMHGAKVEEITIADNLTPKPSTRYKSTKLM
jgi:hypothetical protein